MVEALIEVMFGPGCTGLPDFACDEAFLFVGVFKTVSDNSGPSQWRGEFDMLRESSEFDIVRGSEPARVRRPSNLLLLSQRKAKVSTLSLDEK